MKLAELLSGIEIIEGLIPTIYSFSKKSMLYVAEQQNSHLTVYVKKKL